MRDVKQIHIKTRERFSIKSSSLSFHIYADYIIIVNIQNWRYMRWQE